MKKLSFKKFKELIAGNIYLDSTCIKSVSFVRNSSYHSYRCYIYFDADSCVPSTQLLSCADLNDLFMNSRFVGRLSFYVDYFNGCLCLNIYYKY